MADKSAIEWTDATWQPITGCSIVSPGCTNCYAMRLAGTRLQHHPSRAGLTTLSKAGPVWNGQVRFNEQWLLHPLRWKKPRRIFVCAHGDLFHESVPDEWIDRVFAVMALCPQHTFQVLTKRSARMREWMSICKDSKYQHILAAARSINWFVDCPGDGCYLENRWSGWPLPNVWLGVSTEDQRRADERIPDLLATPATVRFISAEPLLGAIDLTRICIQPQKPGSTRVGTHLNALAGRYCESGMPYLGAWDVTGPCPPISEQRRLDLVIGGGESGPGARPMHPDLPRGLRDQCAAAGVPFLFKQWGAWLPGQNDEYPGGDGRKIAHWQDGGWGARLCKGDAARNYVMWSPDGVQQAGGSRSGGNYFKVAVWAQRVGKQAAGRLLDGVEHNGMLG